ncbi:hypothetical protein CFIO01_02199 [Colletotrichum fioriniae PJ7]|uniref:Uncharacterized protein n=1 Tax=Colletotrichum fioriniae PJ7 TaxID=1445577 RepID=A0A010RWP5_9PEZI|nr:hypothetical protein CFIO01_02199 [Colletotrichum fioriniae PJ7]
MNGSRPRDDGRVLLKEVAYGPENGVPSSSGFVDGIAENVRVSSILLDPGSMVDVVNLTFMERNNIPRVRMKEPMAIRMADSLVIFLLLSPLRLARVLRSDKAVGGSSLYTDCIVPS